jgi:hypothetical protein
MTIKIIENNSGRLTRRRMVHKQRKSAEDLSREL